MEISPDVLEFKAPLTESASQPLYLTNTSEQHMAYKIKTTAPKLYCVRPNASIIPPGEKVEVSIVRQGKDGTPDSKHKDKFLVLSAPVDGDAQATENFVDLWSDIETNRASSIVNKKIRVHYESQDDQAGHEQSASSPSNANAAAAAAAGGAALGGGGAAAAMSQKDNNATNGHFAEDSARSQGEAGEFITPSKPAANDEISQAKEKISAMSQDMKSSPSSADEKRDVAGGSSSSSAAPPSGQKQQSAAIRGVPVPVVLIVALFAFLIGWKLF